MTAACPWGQCRRLSWQPCIPLCALQHCQLPTIYVLLQAVCVPPQHILGPNNLAFKSGPAHKAIRKSFLALFTRKALGTYLQLQDGIIRRHLQAWGQVKGEREIRNFVRWALLLTHWRCQDAALVLPLQFCRSYTAAPSGAASRSDWTHWNTG